MKKFLMLFLICFITIPKTLFALTYQPVSTILLDSNNFAIYGTCRAKSGTNNCNVTDRSSLLFNRRNNCYITDGGNGDYRCKHEYVCILGQAENKLTTPSISNNSCWQANEATTDTWENPTKIQDCEIANGPWTKNSFEKTAVFVLENTNTVITTEDGLYPKTIIYPESSIINSLCIGYVCKEDNDSTNHGYGYQDGSCTPPQPEDNNEDNGGGGGDGGGGDGGNEPEPDPSEFPDPPAEPKDNSAPEPDNIVKPYLDLLID